ncbi:MAG: hypothetical protein K9J17_08300 [Flavobacteriales bacterium]|nr:hypothetical protein [Flavobacteriales bacterium]
MDKLKLPSDPELARTVVEKTFESEKHAKELGVLGRFFGSGDSGKINIAGLFIFLIFLFGVMCTVLIMNLTPTKCGITILELWGITTPLLTLALGYIFGKNN